MNVMDAACQWSSWKDALVWWNDSILSTFSFLLSQVLLFYPESCQKLKNDLNYEDNFQSELMNYAKANGTQYFTRYVYVLPLDQCSHRCSQSIIIMHTFWHALGCIDRELLNWPRPHVLNGLTQIIHTIFVLFRFFLSLLSIFSRALLIYHQPT